MTKAGALRARNQLRIIAGKWRGRKIQFEPSEGLRPTPDRVRETVFNWLQFEIVGKNCLDLFAGSGALGFEALSRGASSLSLVETQPSAITNLQLNVEKLQAKNVHINQEDVLGFLQQKPAHGFELIFLDPPYKMRVLQQCIDLIEKNQWLTGSGLLYFEQPKQELEMKLSASWVLSHSKKTGNICYYLATFKQA